MKAKMLPASEMIEDWDLYPRHAVDDNNVRNIALALTAGAKPPPCLLNQHRQILDGWHRRRAYVRNLGPTALVPYLTRETEDANHAFRIAIEENVTNARQFDEQDRARIVLRLARSGMSTTEIALVLHTTENRVEDLQVGVGYSNGDIIRKPVLLRVGSTEPLKLTQKQIEVAKGSNGWRTSQTAKQLTKELEAEIVDLENPKVVESLWALHTAIEEFVPPVED